MANISIRVPDDIKQQASALFSDLGLDMTTAINVFLRQAVKEQAIPFRIGEAAYNQETLDAIQEVREMKKHPEQYKSYADVDEMFKELLE